MTALLRSRNRKGRYFELLVDSGADYTLISQYDAALIGVNYKKIRSKEQKIEMPNLTCIKAKKVSLELELRKCIVKIPVLVAEEEVECLLGRKGVFDYFDVFFEQRKGRVVFKR